MAAPMVGRDDLSGSVGTASGAPMMDVDESGRQEERDLLTEAAREREAFEENRDRPAGAGIPLAAVPAHLQ